MNFCTLLTHDLRLVRLDGQTQLVCSRCDEPWTETLFDHRNTSKRLQAMKAQLSESRVKVVLGITCDNRFSHKLFHLNSCGDWAATAA